MEYSATTKRNSAFATTWLDLEGIILGEMSQRKIIAYYHLHVELKKKKKVKLLEE